MLKQSAKALIVGVEDSKGLGQPGRRVGESDFRDWPRWNDITHQKMWCEWIYRAYQGGLRVMVVPSHNSSPLDELALDTRPVRNRRRMR
jgi:hypothetical protein